MGANELELISNFLLRAECPEDVFGNNGKTRQEKEDAVKQAFRKLAKALHPDVYNGDDKAKKLAEETFKKLEQMREEANACIAKELYGKRERFSWKVPVIIKGKYILESVLAGGHIADLHIASIESSSKHSNVLLKIARSSDDNDLLKAEENALEKIHAKLAAKGSKDWPSTIPKIQESFLLDEGGLKRRVNVMEPFNGFFTAKEIRDRLPQGVDGRTIGWMWKRLLVILEWINKAGYVHGAVLPPHVMFFPDNDGNTNKDIRKHSIRLIDFCYAVDYKARTRLSAWVPEYKDLYAPEIIEKKPLGGYTDLYMGASTMLFLTADLMTVNSTMSRSKADSIPQSITRSLLSCMKKDPKERPQSIGKYFEEFSEILKKEFGAPKYHDFNLPGI